METIIVSASIDNLTEIMDFVEIFLDAPEYSMRDIYYVNVSVEEIFTNIVSYAYNEQENGQIEISCGFVNGDEKRLRICFKDWGKAYNPLEWPDPDFRMPFNERPIGGLGVFIVKSFMDYVQYRYEDGCNCLTIEKVL